MERVEIYLQKSTAQGGSNALNLHEKEELRHLSLLAEAWEDGVPLMSIRQPRTLTEMLELKMYERKLKQKDLAALLGVFCNPALRSDAGKTEGQYGFGEATVSKIGY